MQVFELASRHMTWLSRRQEVTASNIANANTPGYQARETPSFSTVLAGEAVTLIGSNAGHLTIEAASGGTGPGLRSDGWDISLSGNNVTLEEELMKASETGRMMSFDTSIVRSFHRMLISSVRV